MYEESDEHFRRRKIRTFCDMIFFLTCGAVGFILIIFLIFLMVINWFFILFIIILLFIGNTGVTILKDRINDRFQDKLTIYETGINFLNSSGKEFISFELIENIKYVTVPSGALGVLRYYTNLPKRKKMLEIILKDGTSYFLASKFKKELKFINKIISANY